MDYKLNPGGGTCPIGRKNTPLPEVFVHLQHEFSELSRNHQGRPFVVTNGLNEKVNILPGEFIPKPSTQMLKRHEFNYLFSKLVKTNPNINIQQG